MGHFQGGSVSSQKFQKNVRVSPLLGIDFLKCDDTFILLPSVSSGDISVFEIIEISE